MPESIPNYTCSSCKVDWSTGNFTPDCPECGGAALQTPCPLCKGKCGAKWDRSTEKSHRLSIAEWQGQCQLPEKDQKKIREQRIQDYENERNAKTGKKGPKPWERDGKPVSKGIRLFVILGIISTVRHCDDIKQFLGINSTVEPPAISREVPYFSPHLIFGFKSARGKIYFSEMASTYSLQENGYYELSDTKSVFWSEFEFDKIKEPRIEETDTELPDKALGEYDRMKLIISPNEDPIMRNESLGIGSDGLKIVHEVEAQVEFVKGQASDIAIGNPVVLKYTKQGLKKLREALEDQVGRDIQETFRSEFRANPDVELAVKVTKMSNETMTIDGNMIRSVADGPTVTEFHLKNK